MNRTSRLERHTSAVTQSDVKSGRSTDRHRRVAVALFAAYIGGCALLFHVSVAHANPLYEQDGVRVSGWAKIEEQRAAMCLGEKNAEHQLSVWRVDYAVVNESGRQLESVTAQIHIASPMPPCEKWSSLSQRYVAFDKPEPVLWGNSVHMLHSSGLAANDTARGAVFVLVSHDQKPRFTLPPTLTYEFAAPQCSEPAPLGCWHSGKLRLDPTLLMISRRYAKDDAPDEGEIDPFGNETTNFELRLAGFDLAFKPWEAEIRLGVNGSVAISNYVHSVPKGISPTNKTDAPKVVDEIAMMTAEENVLLTVGSISSFAQFNNLFRLEFDGCMQ